MNLDNPVVRLCIEGTQAEFQGQMDKARSLYKLAWELAQNDYEACIAAHYVARHQEDCKEQLHWNQVALARANASPDDEVKQFYPSLFLNMGQSCELLGRLDEAKRYYEMAAELGVVHQREQGSTVANTK